MRFNRSYPIFGVALSLMLLGASVNPGWSQSRRQPPTSNEKKNKRPDPNKPGDAQQEPLPKDLEPAKTQDIENYYAVNVSFRGVTDTATRRSLLSLPTTWKLSTEQIELLRRAGAELVRQSPDFQRLMRDVGNEAGEAPR